MRELYLFSFCVTVLVACDGSTATDWALTRREEGGRRVGNGVLGFRGVARGETKVDCMVVRGVGGVRRVAV